MGLALRQASHEPSDPETRERNASLVREIKAMADEVEVTVTGEIETAA